MYVSKTTFKTHVNLLLIEEGKPHYVLIKDFSTFMHKQTLHHDWKRFCNYGLQTLLLCKRHINDCFENFGKQMIKMDKKDETVKFKNYTRKIKSSFMIYAGYKSILVPENNEKQKQGEPYTTKYQNHVSFGYKLKYDDDQFSKPVKLYLRQDCYSYIYD